ncbi:MAG TPA: tautomerase family protein [Candidatus Acidoferrales bacterium]|nr:tautomerase family protein [Candidatus Acidoferrales bacterium]
MSVRLCADAFTRAQHQQLIRDITDAFVKMGGEGLRPSVTVVVDEVADGLWGDGGEILDLEKIASRRKARRG